MTYSALFVKPCADVTYIGYFLIDPVKKVKNEIKNWIFDQSQNLFGFMLYFKVCNHNFYSIVLISKLCCAALI